MLSWAFHLDNEIHRVSHCNVVRRRLATVRISFFNGHNVVEFVVDRRRIFFISSSRQPDEVTASWNVSALSVIRRQFVHSIGSSCDCIPLYLHSLFKIINWKIFKV